MLDIWSSLSEENNCPSEDLRLSRRPLAAALTISTRLRINVTTSTNRHTSTLTIVTLGGEQCGDSGIIYVVHGSRNSTPASSQPPRLAKPAFWPRPPEPPRPPDPLMAAEVRHPELRSPDMSSLGRQRHTVTL
ncbi:hypothetical protein E2C01_005979 [Portunus trituberculatus]|uniref:Uncharacterized protein n=1 Tax=Portunus trituberculatus TaxID=210409 RepID=A0A5B7D0K0_PORTR|nr:hypothetical protein [Portunus trituberculatus]